MKMKINDAVSSEIKDLEDLLIRSINSDIGLATEVSSHLVNAGGKRIRPFLVCECSKLFDVNSSNSQLNFMLNLRSFRICCFITNFPLRNETSSSVWNGPIETRSVPPRTSVPKVLCAKGAQCKPLRAQMPNLDSSAFANSCGHVSETSEKTPQRCSFVKGPAMRTPSTVASSSRNWPVR